MSSAVEKTFRGQQMVIGKSAELCRDACERHPGALDAASGAASITCTTSSGTSDSGRGARPTRGRLSDVRSS